MNTSELIPPELRGLMHLAMHAHIQGYDLYTIGMCMREELPRWEDVTYLKALVHVPMPIICYSCGTIDKAIIQGGYLLEHCHKCMEEPQQKNLALPAMLFDLETITGYPKKYLPSILIAFHRSLI